MKNFILAIALVMALTGCNSLHGTEGALTGGLLMSSVGGGYGRIAAIALGTVAGYDVGSSFDEPTAKVTRTVRVIHNPGYHYGTDGYDNLHYSGRDNHLIGYCESYDTGDNDDHRHYSDRGNRLTGYRDSGSNYFAQQARQQRVSSDMVVEETVTRNATYPNDPKVSNYLKDKRVHDSCKTGNLGADSACLASLVPALVSEQAVCECRAGNKEPCGKVDVTKYSCPDSRDYVPGELAGTYHRLSLTLKAEQIKRQGGEMSFK